jgi:anti-sigma B factor antagonist
MKTPSAMLSVWVRDGLACVKIAGRANFSSSVDFKSLLERLSRRRPHHFVLDLSECLLMDSTFLGVLAGLGRHFQELLDEDCENSIEIFNPSRRITDMLDNLGITHLFKVTTGQAFESDHLEPVNHAPTSHDRRAISRTCLEAHQTLMEINPANVPKFKDVTRFLAEDLLRMEEEDRSASPV